MAHRKKLVGPSSRKAAVRALQEHGLSQRAACRLTGCPRSVAQYKLRRTDEPRLVERLKAIAMERRRFGYRRIGMMLRREGIVANHKRGNRAKSLRDRGRIRTNLPTIKNSSGLERQEAATTRQLLSLQSLEPQIYLRPLFLRKESMLRDNAAVEEQIFLLHIGAASRLLPLQAQPMLVGKAFVHLGFIIDARLSYR